ncbi:MAG TPA: ATP synthase F1 subunit epsilon [Methylomirabilota bacterium]|nr:ATP synthase F1 subunit epsilon [Methylomirabilota bacterium]
MKFKIVTPEKILLETEADSVTLPTQMGEITVLPHHIPLVANLAAGEASYKHAGKQEFFAISGGVLEVKKDSELVILADTAEAGHEIDLKEAEAARDAAKQLMTQASEPKAVAEAAAAFGRHVARIKVAHKHRTKTHQHIQS